MISDTLLLLQLRWQLTWNAFLHRSIAARVLSVMGGLLVAFFVALGAGLFGLALGALLTAFPNADLAALLPGGLLTLVMLLLLLTGFGVALGTLFLTNDLEILMSAPVDSKAVFLSKMLEGMAPSYMIIAVTAVPSLLAYGMGLGYGPAYYLGALLVVLAAPLLPVGLAAVLVMLVARVAPVRRVREMLGVMGALFGLSCAVIGNTSRYWAATLIPNTTNAETALENVKGILNIPVPPLIAGRALGALGTGNWGGAIVPFGAYLVLTVGIFALSVWVANSLYAAGWLRMQSSGSAHRSRQRNERAASRSGLLGRGPAWLAITFKDWRVIPRDLRNFAQMLAPLVILPIVFFNMLNSGGRRGENPFRDVTNFGHGVDGTGVLASIVILTATLLVFGRIAETAVSMEAKSWWLMKAAPISPGEVLWGKFVSAAVPFVLVSTVLLAIATWWKQFNLGWVLYGWFGIELLGLGLLAMGVGLSVPWARLDWDDPRRMLPWQTSILTIVSWAIVGVIGGIFLCLPVFAQMLDPGLVAITLPIGALMATAFVAAAGYGTFRFGMSRLADVGEA
jgi:ABC-2 type transport system permease protein